MARENLDKPDFEGRCKPLKGLTALAGRWRGAGMAVAAALLLAACTAAPPPHVPYKLGKPYRANGVWYVPRANPNYDAVGVASWYGGRYHGRRTASGQIFNMHAFTAAHPTLPFGTRVRVTNLANGWSVVVTINDRGPFVKGRIIDVSRRVARRLGFQHRGTARVRVRAVDSTRG